MEELVGILNLKTFTKEDGGASFLENLNKKVGQISSFRRKTHVVSGTHADDLSVL